MEKQVIVLIVTIVAIIAFIFIKGFFDTKRNLKNFRFMLKNSFGQPVDKKYEPTQYQNISKYHQKNRGEYDVDDITWNDLSMDSVYMQMNSTYSSAGEEYLYHLLRSPLTTEEKRAELESMIQYFTENEDARVELQIAFSRIGKTGKYSLYDYLDFLDDLGERKNEKHLYGIFAYISGIVALFLNPFVGMVFLIGTMCYSLISYTGEKSEIEPYYTSLLYVLRIVKGIETIKKADADVIKPQMETLNGKKKAFSKFLRKGKWLERGDVGSDPLSVVYLYLKMMLHLDLMVFNTMLREVRKHNKDINDIVTIMGRIEASIAIASYRASLEHYCIPQFDTGNVLKIENAYHPLISEPVKNSITANKGVLLTGSNASGKSTFLKTVAINVILAQTINTSLSDEYSAPIYRIYSSMALKDDLYSGESYYIVEIKALKRIMDAMNDDNEVPVLCFVDEVLRGTNTVERIAASTQIMKSLSGNHVKCFAATHDIELTHLLENDYENYHFEEEVIDDDVVFNYLLKTGRATTRNAIKLLSVMGYDETIIDNANAMAAAFIEKGHWNSNVER